jgi:small-conductance mechanosensitive channel
VTALADPRVRELLVSLAILLGSYLAARAASYLFGVVLARAARRTATALDGRLVKAVEPPLTRVLFLLGVYAAVHRSPLPPRWIRRLDEGLFVLAVLLITLAAVRSYGIVLAWYGSESKTAARDRLAAEFVPFLSKAGNVVIVLLAAIAILKHFGQDFSSLVVSLGVGSLAIGLAAQDTLANMFAGFTLMLDRPFRIGDRVQLASGELGDVEAIGMRATRIRTADETTLVVPNSLLVKERLLNLTQPTRAITTRVDVGVAYGSDLARVRRILTESALASDHVDREREPVAVVTRFGEFSVVLRVVFWAKDYVQQGLAASEVHEEIYRRLSEAGIEIPLSTRRIIQEVGR